MARRNRATTSSQGKPMASTATAAKPLPVLPVTRTDFGKSLVNWLFPAYVILIAAGYGVLLCGIVTGSDRCLFHAMNAATLTGFTASSGGIEIGTGGQVVLLLLMAGGALFSLIVGGLAIVRILRLPFSDRRVIGASFVVLILATAIGTIGSKIAGGTLFESLFLGVSAFANAGLTTGGSPGASAVVVHVLLLPLAIVGGLGVTVLLEIVDRARGGAPLSRHARTTLFWLAAVYFVGFVAILIARWPGASLSPDGWRDLLASTSALVINSRSFGLPVEYMTSLSRVTAWLVIGLMAIGAGSGGTAGGLKVTTLAELAAGFRQALRGERVPRSFGIALAWLGIYGLMLLIATLLMLSHQPEMPGDRVFFLAASAVSNVGLSHDPISVTGDGLYALSAAMFAGRVVPLLVLWWMADTTSDADLAIG